MQAEPDEDAWLLDWVYRRLLATAETDGRRLHRKNAKALWITIEQSEREAAEAVITHKYRGSQQFSRVEYSTQIY